MWFSDALGGFEAALVESFDYGIHAVRAIPELEPLIMDKLFWGAVDTLVLNPLRPEEAQASANPNPNPNPNPDPDPNPNPYNHQSPSLLTGLGIGVGVRAIIQG